MLARRCPKSTTDAGVMPGKVGIHAVGNSSVPIGSIQNWTQQAHTYERDIFVDCVPLQLQHDVIKELEGSVRNRSSISRFQHGSAAQLARFCADPGCQGKGVHWQVQLIGCHLAGALFLAWC